MRSVVVFVGVFVLGCGGEPAAGKILQLSADAEPCSVHGMIAQDTDTRTLESCGSSDTPVDANALACLMRLAQTESPAFVTLTTGLFSPPSALVGATFDGEYGMRVYMPGDKGTGSRSAAKLVAQTPDATRLHLMPQFPAIECSP